MSESSLPHPFGERFVLFACHLALAILSVLAFSSQGQAQSTFGTVLGAVLLTEVLNAAVFLGLTETYQYVFQGALIVIAALTYSAVRRRAGV